MCLFRKKPIELTHRNIYKVLHPHLQGGLPKKLCTHLFKEDGEIRNFKYKGSFINELKDAGIQFDEDELLDQYRHTTRILRGAFYYLREYKHNRSMESLYPNLEFISSDYANKGTPFEVLHGMIRPVDDPLWLTYYPPNHADDRSSVRPSDSPATHIDTSALPSVERDFQFGKALKKLARSGRYYQKERSVTSTSSGESAHKLEPIIIDLDKILIDAINEVYGDNEESN